MVIAASKAIAECVLPEELSPEFIIPSVFNRNVAPAVSAAVSKLARDRGLTKNIPESI
jgi:malate dehydrogenase (oxaloacetate-decarboxylating)